MEELKSLSLEALKALVYDHIATIENSQRAMKILNEEIGNRISENNTLS